MYLREGDYEDIMSILDKYDAENYKRKGELFVNANKDFFSQLGACITVAKQYSDLSKQLVKFNRMKNLKNQSVSDDTYYELLDKLDELEEVYKDCSSFVSNVLSNAGMTLKFPATVKDLLKSGMVESNHLEEHDDEFSFDYEDTDDSDRIVKGNWILELNKDNYGDGEKWYVDVYAKDYPITMYTQFVLDEDGDLPKDIALDILNDELDNIVLSLDNNK